MRKIVDTYEIKVLYARTDMRDIGIFVKVFLST